MIVSLVPVRVQVPRSPEVGGPDIRESFAIEDGVADDGVPKL